MKEYPVKRAAVRDENGVVRTVKLGGDGGGAGRRTCRFVVGTATAGWTEADCDFLCDGVDDQVEICAAIEALPESGGEVLILDGEYNLSTGVVFFKQNVTLSGSGRGTTLIGRDWDPVIAASWKKGETPHQAGDNVIIRNLHISRKNVEFTGDGYPGMAISISYVHEVVIENCYLEKGSHGVYVHQCRSPKIINNTIENCKVGIETPYSFLCLISGNMLKDNGTGIKIYANSNDNVCSNNIVVSSGETGIKIGSSRNLIKGNYIRAGSDNWRPVDYGEGQYSIYVDSGAADNFIVDNLILGKNYVDEGGTGNTFTNNKFE